MWKAKINEIVADEEASKAVVTIEYFNTDARPSKIVEEKISDPLSIQKIAVDGIAELNRIDAINTLIADQDLGDIALPPPPVAPTQTEIDLQNFQKWLGLVQLLAAAKSLGWITGNEAVVVDAKNKVMALGTVNIPKLFL